MFSRSASTFADICFGVSHTLEQFKILAVLTGESAAAIYAPYQCTAEDAIFSLPAASIEDVELAVKTLGFRRIAKSRTFDHRDTRFGLEFPRPVTLDGNHVHPSDVLHREKQHLRIIRRIDCIRERLGHYYLWNDRVGLEGAIAVANEVMTDREFAAIREWTEREARSSLPKFEEFKERLTSVTPWRGAL